MNPFKSTATAESPEMKALFKELSELNARICLQYAEEKGCEFNIDTIASYMQGSTAFDIVMFKQYAIYEYDKIPKDLLSPDERIAVAAHEAYKRMTSK